MTKLKKSRLGLKVIRVAAIVAGISVSAVAGALVQSKLNTKHLDPEHVVWLNQAQERDAMYVQQSVQQLAQRVGDLQAKVIEIESLGRRLAEQSGVQYTDPEAILPMAAVEEITKLSTAQDLGRELDSLYYSLSERQDWFTMLDSVFSQRLGNQARFPAIHPVDASYLSSDYGWRRHPITGRHTLHEGIDFSAPIGTPIVAAAGGIVTEARYRSGYGKMVEIAHGDGLVTRYAHASSLLVGPGEVVEKGQLIARVGATGRVTGPHLHFEVRLEDQPLDPNLFLPKDYSDTLLVQTDMAK